jgi:hypothetical protein
MKLEVWRPSLGFAGVIMAMGAPSFVLFARGGAKSSVVRLGNNLD